MSGKVKVLAAVTGAVKVLRNEVPPLNWILPFWLMVNRESPDEEAVNKSPLPLLSTTKPAKEELAETEAEGPVPASALAPKTWNVAELVAFPPMRRSSVRKAGARAPLFLWNQPTVPDAPLLTRLPSTKSEPSTSSLPEIKRSLEALSE